MTAILGISGLVHDSAAALLVDGRVAAAAQEERFTRRKGDDGFPDNAIDYCLGEAGLDPKDVDYVAFYEKPLLKLERTLETYLAVAPRGFASFARTMPPQLIEARRLRKLMSRGVDKVLQKRSVFMEHHESHAASAFFPSPFEESAILIMDGVGEWATASTGLGRGNRLELTHRLQFPNSLGLVFGALTDYCGFRERGGEEKLMSLTIHGEPRFAAEVLDKVIDLKADGSFRVDTSYFNWIEGVMTVSKKLQRLFGAAPRHGDAPLEQIHKDVAASIQAVTEEILLRIARHIHETTGMKNLCLAGGVALNGAATGRLLAEGPFERLWIQPAAGDAGGALGAALLLWYQLLENPRPTPDQDKIVTLLGAAYGDDEIESFLTTSDAAYDRVDGDTLCDRVAEAITEGKVVGWFQGRMEFGSAAFGARSVLGDARNADMPSRINLGVKFREAFHPVNVLVLQEHAAEYFNVKPGPDGPLVPTAASIRNAKLPASNRPDAAAHIQVVGPQHGLLYTLMQRFLQETGCPVMLHAGFNLDWAPIVQTPREAYETFMSCDMDMLCLGRCVLDKDRQQATVKVVEENTSDEVFDGKLTSPCCHRDLQRDNGRLRCPECSHEFEITSNIPQLFWPHEQHDTSVSITDTVKSFYEETPFPNYDDHDSVRSLIEKSRRGRYARRLGETIPYNSSILEVGCGTGQLTNFLGTACRRVIGADLCLNSLRLGEAFRKQHGLTRVRFMQMNLFRPALKPEQFDVVLCNGVLMTTIDPQAGFRQLVPLVKPGGYLVIGLYNRYGRLMTDFRRQIFRITGGRAKWIDPVLRKPGLSEAKRKAWYADQYCHPRECKHTYDNVLDWFDEAGIEFVRGVPALRSDYDGLEGDTLFEPQPRGTALDRLVSQLGQIFAEGQKEGGFFIMIGRKPGAANAANAAAATRVPEPIGTGGG